MLAYGKLERKKRLGTCKRLCSYAMVNAPTKEAKDYVISTGRMETIRKFIELTAKQLGWNKNKNEPAIIWEGEGINEIGRRADNNKVVIRVDPKYFRPTEVEELGDSSNAYKDMGWEPTITLKK